MATSLTEDTIREAKAHLITKTDCSLKNVCFDCTFPMTDNLLEFHGGYSTGQFLDNNLFPVPDKARLNVVTAAVIFWSMRQGCGRQPSIF